MGGDGYLRVVHTVALIVCKCNNMLAKKSNTAIILFSPVSYESNGSPHAPLRKVELPPLLFCYILKSFFPLSFIWSYFMFMGVFPACLCRMHAVPIDARRGV